MSFLPEIQLMMHGFGDARRALRESAALVETVVHQQMTSLLHQALEGCEARGARDISPEDILFIVRHDRVKLQRLLHYLAVRDESRELQRTVGPGDPADATNGESGEPMSRKKQCVNFLQSIDQFGQYEPVYTYSLPDPGKLDRAYRLDAFTKHMSSGRYKEFCEARRASFCPSLKVGKFRDWLLADQSPDIKLTQQVLELLNFLAYETVAQLVDLALLVRRDKGGEDVTDVLHRYVSPLSVDPTHPHVLLQQPVAVDDGGGGAAAAAAALGGAGGQAITPDEVREAVRRYFANCSPLAAFSKMRSPVNTRLFVA